ncbi:MAG TPA: zinc-ribbon domain containing protein [Allocoleopsis sp.]
MGIPDFVERGYYIDIPFTCKDCGKREVWSASQQKWWYEVAKGGVWTTARRCHPCRQRERERREIARQTHLEGLAHKQAMRETEGL